MSLSVPQRFITNLDDFTWGKDWRARRIIREKRTDGEYFFANIVRYFGENENTHDYDIADSYVETAWLGRNEKFVGSRIHDTDPDSKTFGKRVYSEAVTETITETNLKGKPTEREVLVKGKVIYEYTLPVNPENIKKLKTLMGAVALNQETQMLFVYGSQPPAVVDPETFFEVTVGEYLQSLNDLNLRKKKDSINKK
jgi:hypothetical protein